MEVTVNLWFWLFWVAILICFLNDRLLKRYKKIIDWAYETIETQEETIETQEETIRTTEERADLESARALQFQVLMAAHLDRKSNHDLVTTRIMRIALDTAEVQAYQSDPVVSIQDDPFGDVGRTPTKKFTAQFVFALKHDTPPEMVAEQMARDFKCAVLKQYQEQSILREEQS